MGLTSFNDGVEVTGISTITSLDNTDVNVSGTATIATANITTISNTPTFNGGANFSGVVTASQFVGGGQIGIGTTGDGSAGIHPVGFGVSFLEFRNLGFTTANIMLLLELLLLVSKVAAVVVVVQVLVSVQHLVMRLLVLLSPLVIYGIIQDLDDYSYIIKMIIAHSG